jgi:exodeoxyribonuclease III
MRIATWNCCRGKFDAKVPLLDGLCPDVAVVQEVARPTDPDQALWYGNNPRQGLAVMGRNGYTVEPLPVRAEVQRHIVPIQVGGPHRFLLLAVWSRQDRLRPYVQAVIHAVEQYRDLIQAQPSVVVGDFNSNAIWDRKRKGARDHSALVRLLAELGLVSAYHVFHHEAQGAESRATHYFRWSQDARYHVDHCFVPAAWADRLISVTVGGYSDWAEVSDHRPVLVEITI